MDKNTVIGFSLIFLILIGWNYMTSPTAEEIEKQEQRLDSLKQAQQLQIDSVELAQNSVPAVPVDMPDSLKQVQLSGTHGGFAPAASGTA
ncbi:MAG: YidC/Oxa1 family membrane protein insertase, partial [Saprospiraceae bacterium]